MNQIVISRATSTSPVAVVCSAGDLTTTEPGYTLAQLTAEMHNQRVHGGEFTVIQSLVRSSL